MVDSGFFAQCKCAYLVVCKTDVSVLDVLDVSDLESRLGIQVSDLLVISVIVYNDLFIYRTVLNISVFNLVISCANNSTEQVSNPSG